MSQEKNRLDAVQRGRRPIASAGRPRLALGTAQLGEDYGLIFRQSAPDAAGAFALLDEACSSHIECFDTAQAYGRAQSRIGQWIRARGYAPSIISKVRLRSADAEDVSAFVRGAVSEARAVLAVDRIETMLLHRPSDIDRAGAVDALRAAQISGEIGGWGVSIYSPSEFARAMDLEGISAIEAPMSVLDRRLESAGLLDRAAAQGVAVIARSVFLQGTLLGDPGLIPPSIPGLRAAVARFAALAAEANLDRGTIALAALASIPAVTTVVVGAATPAQIQDIARWWSAAMEERKKVPDLGLETLGAGLSDAALDPRNWPQVLT